MPVTVDVVQGERQGRPVPRRQSAPFAAALFEALEQQPALDVEPPARRVGHKELVEGHRGASGHDLPAAPGRVPRLLGEPEGGDALRDAVPGVVIRLHQRPVIAARAAVVDGGSQSPGVVADRRLGRARAGAPRPPASGPPRGGARPQHASRRSGGRLEAEAPAAKGRFEPHRGGAGRGGSRRCCATAREMRRSRPASALRPAGRRCDDGSRARTHVRIQAGRSPVDRYLYWLVAAMPRQCFAGWCNGSTTRSGRVSLGSNPSPAVRITRPERARPGLFCARAPEPHAAACSAQSR